MTRASSSHVSGPPFNSAQVSTLNFPTPGMANNVNQAGSLSVATGPTGHAGPEDVDHDKIKRLIDKLYMKTIVEKTEDEDDEDDDAVSLGDEKLSRKQNTAEKIARHLARTQDDSEMFARNRKSLSIHRNLEADDDTITNRIFSRNGSEGENKQIIFSRGLREVEEFVPQP